MSAHDELLAAADEFERDGCLTMKLATPIVRETVHRFVGEGEATDYAAWLREAAEAYR